MPRDLSPTATLAKNRLSSVSGWHWLFEIEVPTDPPIRYRLTSNTTQLLFGASAAGGAFTYYPYPIGWQAPSENTKGSIEDATIAVGNIARELQATVENHDMVGQPVRIVLVHQDEIALGGAAIDDEYQILSIETDDQAFVARIGRFNLFEIPFPSRLMLRGYCTFLYKGSRCAYTDSLPLCSKQLLDTNGCVAHGEDEVLAGNPEQHPRRFGGFQGLERAS